MPDEVEQRPNRRDDGRHDPDAPVVPPLAFDPIPSGLLSSAPAAHGRILSRDRRGARAGHGRLGRAMQLSRLTRG